jgi:putative SOS response-associated peptidase YedK
VTAAADGGFVDAHAQRPIVLLAEDAAIWMDKTLSTDAAEHIARWMALPRDAFEWHPVSKAVNKVANNSAALIEAVFL